MTRVGSLPHVRLEGATQVVVERVWRYSVTRGSADVPSAVLREEDVVLD